MTTDTATAPVVVAPTPGSPEYDAAMIAKAGMQPDDAKPEGTPTKIDAPAPTETLILGKFKTQADLEAAYKALEQKQSTAADPNAPKPSLKVDAPTEVQDVLTKAGLTQDALAAEYAKDGKLSDDAYTKLAAVGIPKTMVDGYLRGVAAEASQFETKVYGMAGGEAEFSKMTQWAKANASPEQITAFNDAIDSGDLGRINLAITAFKGAFSNANPTLLGGAQSSAVVGFRSIAEQNAAMQDPRYRKDEAYREDVYKKVAASTF